MMSIWIGNLTPEVTEDDLQTLGETVGHVRRVNVCRNRETGEPLGYGFVKFLDPDHAELALKQLNGFFFMDGASRLGDRETTRP